MYTDNFIAVHIFTNIRTNELQTKVSTKKCDETVKQVEI